MHNPHLRKCVEFPMHYNSKLKMGWTKSKNMGSSRKPTGYVGLAQLWQKRLITLLEFAETISQLSMSLNDEMIII